jgi:hypothetical protein
MIMIAIGLSALVLATIQNWRYRRNVREEHLKVPLSLSSLVGALVSVLGLVAMLAAIFRW